jgi:hypothetical protein
LEGIVAKLIMGNKHSKMMSTQDFREEILVALKRVKNQDLDYAIIVTSDDRYYVQFALQEGGLYGEAVGSAYLADADALSADQESVLRYLGWQRPNSDSAGNWWLTFGEVDAPGRAAGLALKTLAEVYGAETGLRLRTG